MRKSIRSLSSAVCVVVTLVFGAGCAAERDYAQEFRARLDTGHRHLTEGRYAAAQEEANALLGESAALDKKVGDFRVQRLYATWMLVQAHALAAGRGGFLPLPDDASLATAARQQRARSVAHLVAATTFADYATASAQGLDDAPRVHGETALLPASLADLSVADVRDGMTLCHLATHARLGFAVRSMVEDLPAEWRDYRVLDARMAAARLAPNLVPWVHHAYWLALHRRPADHTAAFRFAVRALEADEAAGGVLGTEIKDRMQDWYLGDGPDAASLVFVCPRTGQRPTRDVLYEPSDPTSRLLHFVPHRREDWERAQRER